MLKDSCKLCLQQNREHQPPAGALVRDADIAVYMFLPALKLPTLFIPECQESKCTINVY